MSVLNNGRDSNGSTPVIIKMCLLVRHQLHLVWFKTICVVDDVVAGWRNRSLTDRLADKIEVVTKNETNLNLIETFSSSLLTVPAK